MLCSRQVHRSQTPDWPPIPDASEFLGNQSLKNVFLGNENSTTSGEKATIKDQEIAKEGIVCDPHRSLPPIPGDADPSTTIPDVPLAWVSRATAHGTGPYIPMCPASDDVDDMEKSHFYDDIDQIRKVAQERAMMIKRREEEEARMNSADRAVGKVEERNSAGDMPDLIPSNTNAKFADMGKEQNHERDEGVLTEQAKSNGKGK